MLIFSHIQIPLMITFLSCSHISHALFPLIFIFHSCSYFCHAHILLMLIFLTCSYSSHAHIPHMLIFLSCSYFSSLMLTFLSCSYSSHAHILSYSYSSIFSLFLFNSLFYFCLGLFPLWLCMNYYFLTILPFYPINIQQIFIFNPVNFLTSVHFSKFSVIAHCSFQFIFSLW
jgi:hypothetical protein